MALPDEPHFSKSAKPREQTSSFAADAAVSSKETVTISGGGINGFQPWHHADNDNALIFALTRHKISDIAFRRAARQVFSPNDTYGLCDVGRG